MCGHGHCISLTTLNPKSFQPNFPQGAMNSALIRVEISVSASPLSFFKWARIHTVLHSSASPLTAKWFPLLSHTSFQPLLPSYLFQLQPQENYSFSLISHYLIIILQYVNSKRKTMTFVKHCKNTVINIIKLYPILKI